MSRFRYPTLLLLALLGFLLLNFGLALASTFWIENPVARFTWTAEDANANNTGLAVYGKVYARNVPGQLMHGNFALNTNSCASCHLTHQAPGSTLLFQRSIYNTCSTCHFDATMNTFNVLGGATLGGGRFFDGDFSAQTGVYGVSFHLATGSLQHWQAPRSGFDSPPPAGSPWRQPFSCASCHGAHGTYSNRLLHFNVNGQAERFEGIPLVTVDGEVYLVPASHRDKTPWLHYDLDSPLAANHGVTILNADDADVTHAFRVQNRLGKVWLWRQAEAGPSPYRISFSQATMVNLVVAKDGTTSYSGGVVNFCTACHTGYLQEKTVGTSTYVYTNHVKFRHPIDSDITPFATSGFILRDLPAGFRLEQESGERQLVCLSCHFAHGTDAGLMTIRDGAKAYPAGTTIPAQTRLLRFGSDTAGNREVCLACHQTMPALTLALRRTSSSATELLFSFNWRMDMSTVIPGETLRVFDTVYGPVDGMVDGTVYGTDSYRTLVFTPLQPLPAGEYRVEVTTGVRFWFQQALPQLFSFSIRVGS